MLDGMLVLGMNRDEKLTRVKGLPPRDLRVNGQRVLCPSEPNGGTWIAVNHTGATFALINWYSITARIAKNPVSRGDVVNAVSASHSVDEAVTALEMIPLKQINSFRLIGVFPSTRKIVEWRWDLKTLSKRACDWKTQQWISSGFDEPQAQRIRSATFHFATKQKSLERWIGFVACTALTRLPAGLSPPVCTARTRQPSATRKSPSHLVWRRCSTRRVRFVKL